MSRTSLVCAERLSESVRCGVEVRSSQYQPSISANSLQQSPADHDSCSLSRLPCQLAALAALVVVTVVLVSALHSENDAHVTLRARPHFHQPLSPPPNPVADPAADPVTASRAGRHKRQELRAPNVVVYPQFNQAQVWRRPLLPQCTSNHSVPRASVYGRRHLLCTSDVPSLALGPELAS